MPPRATAFEGLAPDQRAAVELVLRQGRSYGELAELLGLPEETIRARARGGLEALAPDLVPPARAGEVADWLLGQQAERHAQRTRELLRSDPAIRDWAQTVAVPLRTLYGDEIPALPDEDTPTAPEPVREDAPAPRASRLGGALLLGGALVVAAVALFFVLRGGGDAAPGAAGSASKAAATATATAVATGNDIVLRGPAGSKAVGLMRLFQANDGTVRFALAAQGVEPNKAGETYSLWFTTADGGKSQLLGDVKDPVGEKGELTSAGPGNADVDKFPQWFADYDRILVTLDGNGAKEPGKVMLSGDLPNAG